jgi:hypothetical protein
MELKLCEVQRTSSQPLEMEIVCHGVVKRPRGRGRGVSASQPDLKCRRR